MRILYLLLFATIACSQTIPKTASWEYDYQTIAGTPVDSNLIEFRLYSSLNKVNFDMVAQITDTSYYLLQKEEFYNNDSLWFYVTAIRIDSQRESAPSDTVGDYFPILEPDKPYEFKIIDLK